MIETYPLRERVRTSMRRFVAEMFVCWMVSGALLSVIFYFTDYYHRSFAYNFIHTMPGAGILLMFPLWALYRFARFLIGPSSAT